MSLDHITEDYTNEDGIAHFFQSLKGVTKFYMDQSAMDSIADEVTRLYDNGEPVVSGEAWQRAGGIGAWPSPAPTTKTTSSARNALANARRIFGRGGD